MISLIPAPTIFIPRCVVSFIRSLLLRVFFLWILVWIFARARPGSILELPDQKALVFLVLIALIWWFSENIRKVFGDIPVRT
jgi:hypothetical protein